MSVWFTREHEWIRVDGEDGTVGITDYAQKQLGDIVFVELPAIGTTVERGASVAVVESVKAASELYAPVSGKVIATNNDLVDDPALVNQSPGGAGWFFKLRLTNLSEVGSLLDDVAYQAHVNGLE